MDWARILCYITGTVDQELLRRNEYLIASNRVLEAQTECGARHGGRNGSLSGCQGAEGVAHGRF
jgi:hypothetical protein